MRVLGIIAEYNPFHNGHRYHLEQSMALTGADCSVAVMSGNFLQRGEPAMWDKRVRAEMAVQNGIDLVVELPFVFACNNAEQFAYGGISLLNGLGCVTDLAFGCEGDPDELMEAAGLLAHETDEYRQALSEELEKGLSYPSARTQALAACGAESAARLLTQPNNILAAEYLKQCILTGSAMKPRGIHRTDGGYNSEELPGNTGKTSDCTAKNTGTVRASASARAIRAELRKASEGGGGLDGPGGLDGLGLDGLSRVRNFIPAETAEIIGRVPVRAEPFDDDALFPLIAAKIRSSSPQELSQIYAVSEGMENLMKKAVLKARDMESLIAEMKTKRYTRTRLQRALVQSLMGLTAEAYQQILRQRVNYAHVLAFSARGARLLAYIKKEGCAAIPVYSNLSRELSDDADEQLALQYDLLAADLYHIAAGRQIYEGSDLVLPPFIKK